MIDVSDLIGVPFVSRGRNPKTGLDCWGLVIEVGRRMGQVIPDFCVDALDSCAVGAIKTAVESSWIRAEKPEPGVIVGMKLDRDGCMMEVTQHFGVCLDKRMFIHTMEKTGVLVTRFDHPFFKRIITGYYLCSQ